MIQTSLWRQVKIKLDETKTVDGGFRYEEAIPPETIMYFPWGVNIATQSDETILDSIKHLKEVYERYRFWQFGGQESLGRGLTKMFWNNEEKA